jgi:mono/diheme cytochrome c family protein
MQCSIRRTAVLGFAFAALCSNAFAQDDGKYLTILGDCAGCHTDAGGQPYAGGRAMISPFGTFYTSNITPDHETGIGGWTADDFWQALHDGRSRNRGRLYPAMPYPHFALYSRADADAMFAYLQRLPPVRNQPPKNEVRFPLNQRWLVAVWNALYLDKSADVSDPSKSAQWNRGAYLVVGPGHCGDCHTPKNFLYAQRKQRALSGDLVENWWAADLTGDDREGLGTWSESDIVEYLKTGRNEHTIAGGSMAVVIEASTSQMHKDDLAAIAVYLKDLPPETEQQTAPEPPVVTMDAGRAGFREHCQDCHNYDGTGVPRRFPTLAGSPTVQASNPTTILRVILEGQELPAISARPDDKPMPRFEEKLTDGEIADVATYMRNAWGNRASAVSAKQVADLRKTLASEAP